MNVQTPAPHRGRWLALGLGVALLVGACSAARSAAPAAVPARPASPYPSYDIDAATRPQPTAWVEELRLVAEQTVCEIAPGVAVPAVAYNGQVPGPTIRVTEGDTRAMQHDPRGATDPEALRWDGLSMRGEGRNMAEHGRVMADDLALMRAQHRLDPAEDAELAAAAATMRSVGGHLEANGQAMVDEADRLARAFALR